MTWYMPQKETLQKQADRLANKQCEHQATEEYVEDSDNDDQLEIHDEELDEVIGFVFRSDSDSYISSTPHTTWGHLQLPSCTLIIFSPVTLPSIGYHLICITPVYHVHALLNWYFLLYMHSI